MTSALAYANGKRIVVADDSGFMRRLIEHSLTDAGYEVIGTAANGDEALALCERLKPHALTLDLAMPGTHGLDVLRRLRAARSTLPVIVVSAFSPAFGAKAIDALAEGAFDLVAKPAPGDLLESFVSDLRVKVGQATGAAVAAAAPSPPPAPAGERPARAERAPIAPAPEPRAPSRPPAAPASGSAPGTRKIVLIACSTGGPKALAALVPQLPGSLGDGGLIVQHMPAGFTKSLAGRLSGMSSITVREAEDGDAVTSGVLLLAPGGKQLRLSSGGRVRLTDEDPVDGLRPRADLTIADAAALYGRRLLLVVLTGMGKDGLVGAQAVRRSGGRVLAESESSCTVYGMPRAVVEARLADGVHDLSRLPAAIVEEVGA